MLKSLSFTFLIASLLSTYSAIAQDRGFQTHTIRLIGQTEMSDYKEVIDDIRGNVSYPISCTVEAEERVIQVMSKQDLPWISILQSINTEGRFIALLTPLFVDGVKVSHPYTLEKVRQRWAEFRGIEAENLLFVTAQDWSSLTIRARAKLENEFVIIIE